MKNNANQNRRPETLKEKNDMITFKSELEMQYNVSNIGNANYELKSKKYQSTKKETNLKAELKGKKRFRVLLV